MPQIPEMPPSPTIEMSSADGSATELSTAHPKPIVRKTWIDTKSFAYSIDHTLLGLCFNVKGFSWSIILVQSLRHPFRKIQVDDRQRNSKLCWNTGSTNQWLTMKDCVAKPKSIQERVICERAVLPKLFWGGWYWGELHMISRRIRLFETVAVFASKCPGRQCKKIWALEFAESWDVLSAFESRNERKVLVCSYSCVHCTAFR